MCIYTFIQNFTILDLLLSFLKKPSSVTKSSSNKRLDFEAIFRIITTHFLCLLVILSLIHLFFYICGDYDIPQSSLQNTNNSNFESSFRVFALMCIWIPVLEECIFRLWINLGKKEVGIAFAMLYIGLYGHIFSHFSQHTVYRIVIAIVIFITIYKLEMLHNLFRKKRNITLNIASYFSIIAFGLVHITNYNSLTISQVPYIVFIILPQLFAGIILAFIRLRYGFAFSILYHVANNSIAFILTK